MFSGTSDPEPCIAGHYCPLGTGLDPVPCPVNTYLDTTGAAVEADCKSCVKGYICNQTGLYLDLKKIVSWMIWGTCPKTVFKQLFCQTLSFMTLILIIKDIESEICGIKCDLLPAE